MSDRLQELLLEYRKGRDGFDGLALEATRLYLAGQLLPPVTDAVEAPLAERLDDLTPEQVERALDGKLGTVAMTREEYREVLVDLTEFLKAWLRELDV